MLAEFQIQILLANVTQLQSAVQFAVKLRIESECVQGDEEEEASKRTRQNQWQQRVTSHYLEGRRDINFKTWNETPDCTQP